MKMEKRKMIKCTCGCNKSYPIGYSKPCGWIKISNNSIKRLSDNVIFSVGDIIERYTELGKQYENMIISKIDFYNTDSDMYVRAELIKTNDNHNGSTNITDYLTDYMSADNPNTLRFIQQSGIKKEIKDNPVPSIDSLEEKLKEKLREIIERNDSDKMPKSIYLNGALDCFNILKELQNGVESNKEQPKYNTNFLREYIESHITDHNDLIVSEHEMLCQIMNILGYWEEI